MKCFIKIAHLIFFVSFITCSVPGEVFAQKTDLYKTIEDKVSNKDFVFVANSLTPMNGKLRILTSPYDVKISKDSVISYLPYFGTAQEAPNTPEDAGIMFTSSGFDYSFEPGKKKTWDVVIKFKDQRSASQFSFIIYDDGTASLEVLSAFRDPISFRGNIKF